MALALNSNKGRRVDMFTHPDEIGNFERYMCRQRLPEDSAQEVINGMDQGDIKTAEHLITIVLFVFKPLIRAVKIIHRIFSR